MNVEMKIEEEEKLTLQWLCPVDDSHQEGQTNDRPTGKPFSFSISIIKSVAKAMSLLYSFKHTKTKELVNIQSIIYVFSICTAQNKCLGQLNLFANTEHKDPVIFIFSFLVFKILPTIFLFANPCA